MLESIDTIRKTTELNIFTIPYPTIKIIQNVVYLKRDGSLRMGVGDLPETFLS